MTATKRKSDLDMSVLVGYLEILYSRVFTFHREPCSANRLLRPEPIFLPTSSLTPHLLIN